MQLIVLVICTILQVDFFPLHFFLLFYLSYIEKLSKVILSEQLLVQFGQ